MDSEAGETQAGGELVVVRRAAEHAALQHQQRHRLTLNR